MQFTEPLWDDSESVIRFSSTSVISSVDLASAGSCFHEGSLSWLRDCFVFISSGCLLARQSQDGARYIFKYKKCIRHPSFKAEAVTENLGISWKKWSDSKPRRNPLREAQADVIPVQSQLSLDLARRRATWKTTNLFMRPIEFNLCRLWRFNRPVLFELKYRIWKLMLQRISDIVLKLR